MLFVGRSKEMQQITGALGRRNNVIIVGKFGIGRTRLVRHIAEHNVRRWRFIFVDFSRTPGQLCSDILQELLTEKQYRHTYRSQRYKEKRNKIVTFKRNDAREVVFVLDNIARITPQKVTFIRHLSWEGRFLFIAIVERFLGDDDLFLLRSVLMPEHVINLGRISRKASIQFFQLASERNGFQWGADRIRMMAETTGGYPLSMKEKIIMEKNM